MSNLKNTSKELKVKKWGGLFWLFVGYFLCMAGNVFAVTLITDFSRFEFIPVTQGGLAGQSFSNGYAAWIEECYGGSCGGDEKQVILFDGYKRTQLTNIVEPSPHDPGEKNITISDLHIFGKNVLWKEDGKQNVYEIPNYESMVVPPSKFTAFGFNEDMYIFDGDLTKLTDNDFVTDDGVSLYSYEDRRLKDFRQSGDSLVFVTTQKKYYQEFPDLSSIWTYEDKISYYDYQRDILFFESSGMHGDDFSILYFENNVGYIERDFIGPEANLYYLKYNPEQNTAAVPEPATLLLFGTGLLGAFVRRKRKA